MSEAEYQARATIRNFRMVRAGGERLSGSVDKDSLIPVGRSRSPVTMAEWSDKLDAFSCFNERAVLTNAGRLQKPAGERLEAFDANWRLAEALAADADDIAQLEEMEKTARKVWKKGGRDA